MKRRLGVGRGAGVRGKRGDVPIRVLVHVVFAVCSLALLAFFISVFKVSNDFVGIGVMDKMNAQIDAYDYYRNREISVETVESYFRVVEEDGVKYLYLDKYKGNIFKKESTEDDFLFSVRYPLPS